jgi:hypothetical protein
LSATSPRAARCCHCIVALLAIALGTLHAQGHRRGSPRVGVVAFDLDVPAPAALSALGVGLVRGSCGWDVLEPARGVFDWRCSDNVIVGAAQHALRSYMTVNCTPGWAAGGAACFTMPRDLSDWYTFVQRFIDRYARYNTVLSVWNEPNLDLRDDPDGSQYALLFINASRARNAIDPQFVLAGPEVSHHALASGYYARTMDAVQSAQALNPGDVVAVHWYHDGPPLTAYLDSVHAVADRQQVWLSETGYSTPDPAAQAAFNTSILAAFAASGRPWWTHVIFYRLWDGQDCCTEALVTSDYRTKPAFDAIRDWIESADDGSDDRNPYVMRRPEG